MSLQRFFRSGKDQHRSAESTRRTAARRRTERRQFHRLVFMEQLEVRLPLDSTLSLIDIVLGPDGSDPAHLTNVNGTLFFVASNPNTGHELWKSDGTEAGTMLVKDIHIGVAGSYPRGLTSVNGNLYFAAATDLTGEELWKSDGTEAGTLLVKDINPGSSNSNLDALTDLNGILFFRATDGVTGSELWKSDGTDSGTMLVKDIFPGSSPGYFPYSSEPQDLTAVNGQLFFAAYAEEGPFRSLWKSDGTLSGTVLVKSFESTPYYLTDLNGTLFFNAYDTDHGTELWKSNGTESGTVLAKDLIPGPQGGYPEELINVNGMLFFRAQHELTGNDLWKSDGTEVGTMLVRDPSASITYEYGPYGEIYGPYGPYALYPEYLTNVNGALFFRGSGDGERETGIELWKTDGTSSGTILVRDILPGPDQSGNAAGSRPKYLTASNGMLFFQAYESGSSGRELWRSNGTEAGTVFVTDIDLIELTDADGKLFLSAVDANFGQELLAILPPDEDDPVRIDIFSGTDSSGPRELTDVDGTLFFAASNNVTGQGLWRSNGSEASTILLKDFGSAPLSLSITNLIDVDGTLFFIASDNISGNELWKSDGTEVGTVLVKEFDGNGVGINGNTLTSSNGYLFFNAYDALHGGELWKSDGTETGTVLVKDIVTGEYGSGPYYLIDVDGILFFNSSSPTLTGRQLWKSDGTEAGTVLVTDISPGPYMLNVDGTLFLSANDGSTGYELWKSDGTEAGTVLVKDFVPGTGNGYVDNFTNLDGLLLLRARREDGAYDLWKSDGTEAGTVLVKAITYTYYEGPYGTYGPYGGYGLYPYHLTNVSGTVFFSGYSQNGLDASHAGRELWKTDGTDAGTVLVKDIVPGLNGSNPQFLTAAGETLFFTAYQGQSGNRELWRSDGTAEGTVLVKDINPGPPGSRIDNYNIVNVNGTLFFSAYDPDHGQELWFIPPPEDDADGVSNETENGAPNGGDGNDDGILDSEQSNVTSLPNSVDAQYVTLVSPSGTNLVNVVALGDPSGGNGPEDVSFPVGFFEFQVTGIAVGGATTVELFISGNTFANTFYKYGPTPNDSTNHWYEFLYDGTTGAEFLDDRILLHFVDGDRGDSDLIANGIIFDPGGPALITNQPPNLIVTNTADSGSGSLREAIMIANAIPGVDTISFHISGTGIHTIQPTSVLPTITDPVIIDATTQPGYGDSPVIVLNGSLANAAVPAVSDAYGLDISAGSSTIRGLAINGFENDGIILRGGGGNLIANNFIGIAADGTTSAGNRTGIFIHTGSSQNIIGGSTADRNVISGNHAHGIEITGIGADANVVAGNFISTNASGTTAVRNFLKGVELRAGAKLNRIGTNGDGVNDENEWNLISGNNNDYAVNIEDLGTDLNSVAGNLIGTDVSGMLPISNYLGVRIAWGARFNRVGTDGNGMADTAERNIISASLTGGVAVSGDAADDNVVAGNFIGTDKTGTQSLGNAIYGVRVIGENQFNRIGTDGNGIGDTAEGNIISGNTSYGVELNAANNNVVAGNYIGTDVFGTQALPNGIGVRVDGNLNRIGTDGNGVGDVAERNVISGSNLDGIRIDFGDDNIIAGNYIGTDVSGTAALGNNDGILLIFSAHRNRIGTDGNGQGDDAERNVISGNRHDGVVIRGSSTSLPVGNVVAGNYIGVDWTGSSALSNESYGVYVADGAQQNRIGTNADGQSDVAERNVISGNLRAAVGIVGSGTELNFVAGNYIGTNVDGVTSLENGSSGAVGIFGGAKNNRVGTNGDGVFDHHERNLISGNDQAGIYISDVGTEQNVVAGNYIGTDFAGTQSIPNVHGIMIVNGAKYNRLGTNDDGLSDAEERNIISGNSGGGVIVTGTGTDQNIVAGNYIGVDVTGTISLANTQPGVSVDRGASNNFVGGLTPVARNIISGNTGGGVSIFEANGNFVQGNYVGVNAAGTAALGNGVFGGLDINNSSGNLIGGALNGAGNVISGNIGLGIQIGGALTTDNRVEGNYIGTDAAGLTELGNTSHGIRIQFDASNNRIGGATSGSANVIRGNHGTAGVAAESGTGNSIRGNTIYANAGLGIDLGNNGVTANDPGDGDFGVNLRQNFPVLTSVLSSGGSVTIQGSLHSLANTLFALDFFSNAAADPSGFGEGETYLGSASVITDSIGNATFTETLTVVDADQKFFTATATDPQGNTSEFSEVFHHQNEPPTIAHVHDTVTVNEGATAINSGTFSDEDKATVMLTASIGTVAKNDADGTWSWSYGTTDGPDQTQSVTITATDGQNATNSTTFQLTVNNVAPVVGNISAPLDPITVNTAINVNANFTDAGMLDTHTAEWDWGDDTTSAGSVSESNGSGFVAGSHTYSDAGVYTITLTVTDDEASSGSSVFKYVVVYDPSSGFVTGGGWIDSPPGSYAADPALTGKANFGFVAKYHQGANIPSGNSQFQFKAADFDFRSTDYQWLVVAGSNAKFKGIGNVNGESGFQFMITAHDGHMQGSNGVDKFRIKVWNTEGVIYDNQYGATDDSQAATALGGGSIVIHEGGDNLLLDAAAGSAGDMGASINNAQLAPVLAHAVTWLVAQGLNTAQIDTLAQLKVSVAELPGNSLGLASESTNYVWIDRDAAGYGWSLNSREPQPGHIDLLSAITHELGHVLGYDHEALGEFLSVGERRLIHQLKPSHKDTPFELPWDDKAGLLSSSLEVSKIRNRADLVADGHRSSITDSDLADEAIMAWPSDYLATAISFAFLINESDRVSLEFEDRARKSNDELDEDLLTELSRTARHLGRYQRFAP